jgi:GT2 family glycosyltransferase
MQLSIIISNYNTKGFLKQCLKGLLALNLSLEHEIIVVDNHSPDGSAEMVREKFPPVKLIANPINGGCAYAYNKGIKAAQGHYVFIMNTDIVIRDDALEKMYRFMEDNPAVGIAVPKLLNPDGSVQYSCLKFPKFFYPAYRRTFIGNLPLIKKKMADYLMTNWDHNKTQEIDWAIGGAMLVRKSAIDQVGLMDERFFMYLEDTDWCRRFWQAGFKVYYIAVAQMVHYHRRQSADYGLGSIFTKTAQVHIASWFKYFFKYFGKKLPR